MRRTLLSLFAATSLAVAVPVVASAQNWQSINDRQYEFLRRVDDSVRYGSINRTEGDRLRADFNALVRLENEYRRSAPGLTTYELQDLDRRFDLLSDRAGAARNDRYADNRNGSDNRNYDNRSGGYDEPTYSDRGAWVNFEQRRSNLYRRIDVGQRNGQLTRSEADRLRRDFDGLVRLETQYRNSGGALTTNERRELNERYRELSEQVRDSRRDREREYRSVVDIRSDLLARIDAAYRENRLTRTEAQRLRDDTESLIRLEARYRSSSPGMTNQEWAEIDRAVNAIEDRIGDANHYGYAAGANGGVYRFDR